MKLNNGAVLPHGLLGSDPGQMLAGFNKSYKNSALRIGVIKETYPVSHDLNKAKLTTEYDVTVIEQNEDKGVTTILYRNCMSAEGLGSVADFFERTLRKTKKKTKRGDAVNTKGQNGAIVLLLCLDGMSDKGIIVGALTHPDRKTTLKDEDPYLEGEYNGVNIKVDKTGACTLTFKGATDNDGKITDSSQGPTTIKIETDGSYQIDHKTITQRLAKDGKASLTADDDISNTTKKNFNVTATENIALKAEKDFTLDCVALTAKATGSALLECQKATIKSESELNMKGSTVNMEAESMVKIKGSIIIVDGIVYLGGAGGMPVLTLLTMTLGVGNLGMPVISFPISGYATSVFAK